MTKNQKKLLIGAPLLAILSFVIFQVLAPELHKDGNVHDPCTGCQLNAASGYNPFVFFYSTETKAVHIATNNRKLQNLKFDSETYWAEVCPVKIKGLGNTIELFFAFDLCDACSICRQNGEECEECDGDDCHNNMEKHAHPFDIELTINPSDGTEGKGRLVSPWRSNGDLYANNNEYGIVEFEIGKDTISHIYVINNKKSEVRFKNDEIIEYKVVNKEVEILGTKVTFPMAFVK
ncbi:hypothetical protein [uncultured Imperialibacter sp.]|uniref:hypothetical protein n=1 Tax=uncultured Imperialibacter sp. TaxID=1672639 RepID=UPI0030DCD14E|tara:strand:+ start:1736 stop:2437 length:702 start_codon:yes stop_codon:yes gene_type:complete